MMESGGMPSYRNLSLLFYYRLNGGTLEREREKGTEERETSYTLSFNSSGIFIRARASIGGLLWLQ